MAYRSAFSSEFIKARVEMGVGKLGCWIWRRATDREGYGVVGPGAPERKAHRLAYTLFVGPIPEGMTIDHVCFVTSCVNPQHLRVLTVSENVHRQRMQNPIRRSRGQADAKPSHLCRNRKHDLRAQDGGPCLECKRERSRRYKAALRS